MAEEKKKKKEMTLKKNQKPASMCWLQFLPVTGARREEGKAGLS
jgi:hypothetical protein